MIENKLAEFISESTRDIGCNKWIYGDHIKAYVRKGHRMLYGRNILTTLDIASIEVDENKQNQGLFTAFLNKAHELNPWDATYVECVLNPNLAAFLIKNGWIASKTDPDCYYMPKNWDQYWNTTNIVTNTYADNQPPTYENLYPHIHVQKKTNYL